MVTFQVSRAFQLPHAPMAEMEVFLSASNLLDDEARPHNSPLKYIAPLPGRAFQLGLTGRL